VNRTDVLEKRARAAAVAAGELLAALLDVADDAIGGFDADEIAFTLAWSQNAARMQIEFGRFLRDVFPDVFAVLRAGDIDAYRAWMFYDVLRAADPDVAVRVAATMLPDAPELTATEVRRKLRRALLILDPSGAVARMRRTIVDRYLAMSPSSHGTASLYGVDLPADRATAAFERVDAYARGAKTAGDERTLEQLRADTFLDLLEGVAPTVAPVHRRGVVEIAVSLATATGESEEPGELAGYGPIDAETTRELLTDLAKRDDVDWRFSARNADGTLVGHGRIPRSRTKAGATNIGSANASDRDARNSNAGSTNVGSTDAGGRSKAGGANADNSNVGSTNAGNSNVGSTNAAGRDSDGANMGRANAGNVGTAAVTTRRAGAGNAKATNSPADDGEAADRHTNGGQADAVSAAQAAGKGFDWTGASAAARDQLLTGPPIEADPTRRRPSPALARWIIARDRTCRAPGCNAPARVCDIDHTIDHASGGLTSHDNLGLLCRHHHRLKHEGGWTLTQPKPGTFEWRAPDGRIYRK